MQDPIEKLLHEADRQVDLSTTHASDLAHRVLQISRHRRIRNIGLSLLSIGLFSAALISLYPTTSSKPIVVLNEPPVLQKVEQELASLQKQIAMHEQLIDRMEAAEQRSVDRTRLASFVGLPSADDAAERAAGAIVYQADRLLNVAYSSAPAVKAYDEVIAHFPQTMAADQARRRKTELDRKES